MLPSIEICQKRISAFNSAYPNSTFDEFWAYKRKADSEGSMLDSAHLKQTALQLDAKLLRHPKWGLWWTGVPPVEEIERILKNIDHEFETIRGVALGQGRIAHDKRIADAISGIYAKLCGMSHRRWDDAPDAKGVSYLVGKAKVLMFIWGQTPGFDSRLRSSPSLWSLPHLWVEKNRYTPWEFCDILKVLDQWVAAWNEQYSQQGVAFQDLSLDRPIGRIIDIIYWVESDD